MSDTIQQFQEAIRATGLIPPDLIEPGKFHRFSGDGKRKSNTAAWCKLFDDGRGGIFGDYSTGLSESWQASRATPYSQSEREAFKRQIAEARAKVEADRLAEQAAAMERASQIWTESVPAKSHEYLTRKGVQAHGARLYKESLVLPIRDSVGTLQSLQFISADGSKRFLTGGKVQGGYFSIGKPDGVLCVCEGIATGASISEATGYAVAVAFDCGNLLPVAKALREKYPDLRLIVCADDDYQTDGNPGITKATEAARTIGGLVAIPRFGNDRPDMATDFNDMHQHVGLEAVRECIEVVIQAPVADLNGATDTQALPETITTGGDADDGDDKSAKQSTANALIELAVRHCDLFHDDRNDGYAVTTYNEIRRTLRLRSKEFRRWLAGTYYSKTKRAANNEAISTALSVLEAKATFDGRMLELSNRIAMRDGVIYLDMAGEYWRVIKITAKGWEILVKPPVLFRRYSHQKTLPDPIKGGKLSGMHNHLAIKSDDDKLLVEAWLVACSFPDIPRPAITFHGPQGASKTTAARILKSLSDPSVTETVDLGKSPADLAQVLDHHGVPCFDNLTNLPGWAADMLCRGVTGGGFSKRELYSDDSDVILSFKRPMIITGINIPTHAPDLLDRLLLIELERIDPDMRMDEATFWAHFNSDKPMLFGGLLDAIVGALLYLPTVKLDKMPRMADFARIACAYAEFTGVGSEKMLDIIMRHTSRQTQEILDADPVASAVRDFIQQRGTWTGTTGELLGLLNESVPTPRPDGWPRQANILMRKLNVLHATLNEVGISFTKQKSGSNRKKQLTLESKENSSSASSASSEVNIHGVFEKADKPKISSEVSSALEPSKDEARDDKDDKDGIYDVLSGRLVEVEV